MRFELPQKIHSRRDAFQLWCHLIELEIGFHWSDEPTEWVHRDTREQLLSNEVAAEIRDRMKQARKNGMYRTDATHLVAVTRFVGPELLKHVDLDDINGSFARLEAANKAAYREVQRLILKTIREVDPKLRPRRVKRPDGGVTYVV